MCDSETLSQCRCFQLLAFSKCGVYDGKQKARGMYIWFVCINYFKDCGLYPKENRRVQRTFGPACPQVAKSEVCGWMTHSLFDGYWGG